MSKDIDLNSKEWCDIVFKGKNRRFGAYDLRMTSSRRHAVALIIVISFGVLAFLPSILDMIIFDVIEKERVEKGELVRVIEIDLEKPKQETKIAQHIASTEMVELTSIDQIKPAMMEMVDVRVDKGSTKTDKKDKADRESEQERIREENSLGLDASIRDSKGIDAKSLYEETERVMRELAMGRENHETGMGDGGSRGGGSQGGKGGGSGSAGGDGSSGKNNSRKEKPKGDVLVTYELEGRTHVYLHKPAYQCQYGGVVVVAITVNRKGKVLSANVDQATASPDDCIEKMSAQSALASTFSTSTTAPEKQKGKITYRFLAQ